MNTTTTTSPAASGSNIAGSSEAALSSTVNPLQSAEQTLNELRAKLQQAQIDFETLKQREVEAEQKALLDRRKELGELPTRYGFGEGLAGMRSFLGFLGYNFLRGHAPKGGTKAKPPAAKRSPQAKIRSFKGRVQMTDEKRAALDSALRAMPQSGERIPQIAARMGTSRQTCYAHAHKHKITLPSEIALQNAA